MKYTFVFFLALAFVGCKDDNKAVSTEETVAKKINYPENLQKVFDAHGGLEQWNQYEMLSFTLEKPTGKEVTVTNLKSRESVIKMDNHTIGYDGSEVWLNNKDTMTYKGNPKFYYNLMFYFYAMPFILADDGIVYGDAEPLTFEGVTYPGIEISYNDGVGESPEDIYVLYYNPDTYQMEWLGYTVTFFSTDSKELHFRRYSDWQKIDGLLLPKKMVRYNYADNKPTDIHSENIITDVILSKNKMKESEYKMPESAELMK